MPAILWGTAKRSSRFLLRHRAARRHFAATPAPNPSTGDDDAPSVSVPAGFRPPTAPTGLPLSKILTNVFPLSYSEAWRQWRQRHNLPQWEADLLKLSGVFNDKSRTAVSQMIPVRPDAALNEFQVSNNADGPTGRREHVLLVHGYGAGLGFFYKNFAAMSARPGWTLHAVDLLGYGRSTRVPFRIRDDRTLWQKLTQRLSREEKARKAEEWFTESLEAYRKAKGLEKFTVVAHSLGAYIMAAYSVRYPGRIQKLVLVSPAGVSRPNPEAAPVPAWFTFLWERHVSPFSLVRNTGPFGPRFVSGWTSRRFSRLPERDRELLHKYTYGIFNARGSGEYALNFLLGPGAVARRPLELWAGDITCDTVWLYGEKDWIDYRAGLRSLEAIEAANAERRKRKAERPLRSRLEIVPKCGHHVYLDNYAAFNDIVDTELASVERDVIAGTEGYV